MTTATKPLIKPVLLASLALVVALASGAPLVVTATEEQPVFKKISKQCRQFSVGGHRGMHYPDDITNENTLEAFKQAKNAGATVLEIDSWNTSDGVPVVVHDPTWERTIDPTTMDGVPEQVKDTSFSQVKQLRTNGGEKVPTLQQVIKWAGKNRTVTLMVELKWGFTNPKEVAGWVTQHKAKAWFYQSPHQTWHTLTGVEALQKYGMRTGVKMQDYHWLSPEQLKEGGYKFVAITAKDMTKKMVKDHRALGIKVYPKNTSTKAVWRAMVSFGVDGIIATDPGKLAIWQAKGCQ